MYQSDDEAENRQLEREVYFSITFLCVLLLVVLRSLVKRHKK